MSKRFVAVALALAACLTLAGCAGQAKPKTLPPGALNAFDADSYVALMGAQAVLNSVKADIGNLPPAAKPALNKAIASYNLANDAWQSYHAGASSNQAALTASIAQATADVVVLLTQISGGK